MKKHLLHLFSVLTLLSVPLLGQAQCTFTSTAVGGPFTSASTWTHTGNCGTNTIPTATSVIIINGPVALNTDFALTGNVGKLTINSGGSLIGNRHPPHPHPRQRQRLGED